MIIVNNAKEDLTYRAHGLVLELKPGVNIIDAIEFTASEIKNHFGQYVNVIVDKDGTVIKEDKEPEGTKDEETGDETVTEDGDETGEGTEEGDKTEGTGEKTEGGENEGTGETEGTGEKTEDETEGGTTVEVAEKCKPCYEDGKTPSEDDCKACKEKEEAEKAKENKETKKQDKPKRGSNKRNK